MAIADLSYEAVATDVKEALTVAFGPNAAVDTTKATGDKVFVVIASDRFNGMTPRRKQKLVWKTIRDALNDRASLVSIVMVYGTDELL